MAAPLASMSRTRKASDSLESSDATGKIIKIDSPSAIKNLDCFRKNFIGYTLNPLKHTMKLHSGWGSQSGQKEIKEWIKMVGPQLIRTLSRVVRNSEMSLYPLIVTSLLPVFDLCDCAAIASIVSDLPDETLQHMAEDFAQLRSNQSSRQASVDPPVSVTTASPENTDNNTSSSHGENCDIIDATNPNDVLKLMIFMEEWIKSSDYDNKGRVEILIRDLFTNVIKAVVEAKPRVDTCAPADEGFYQLCAYMVLAKVRYGVYTDHKSFQFVELDENKVFSHTDLYAMMKPSYDKLDQDASLVYAFLFQILGVPRDTNLKERFAQSEANWVERTAELVSNFD